jgi:hypothetical protein
MIAFDRAATIRERDANRSNAGFDAEFGGI